VSADHAAELAETFDALTDDEVFSRGAAARERFSREFSSDVTLPQLISVYEKVATEGVVGR
jgi:glycosyltransferase involved in cell wall biosynthesis